LIRKRVHAQKLALDSSFIMMLFKYGKESYNLPDIKGSIDRRGVTPMIGINKGILLLTCAIVFLSWAAI
jgi:hypothetical protein